MNIRKVQDFVVRGKEIFVGLEDSKKTWKLAVRCERMVIHRTSMEAKYSVLIRYLRNKFPECTIHLIYEAGSKGLTSMTGLPRTNRLRGDSSPYGDGAEGEQGEDGQEGCEPSRLHSRESRLQRRLPRP